MQIVELKDTGASIILRSKGYKEIYREIRGAVDLCHRDGSLKKAVAANPAKYIHQVCLSILIVYLHEQVAVHYEVVPFSILQASVLL